MLESVRDRQQTVIEAMRKFVDRLDEALPDLGEERRKKVLDALVDFAAGGVAAGDLGGLAVTGDSVD